MNPSEVSAVVKERPLNPSQEILSAHRAYNPEGEVVDEDVAPNVGVLHGHAQDVMRRLGEQAQEPLLENRLELAPDYPQTLFSQMKASLLVVPSVIKLSAADVNQVGFYLPPFRDLHDEAQKRNDEGPKADGEAPDAMPIGEDGLQPALKPPDQKKQLLVAHQYAESDKLPILKGLVAIVMADVAQTKADGSFVSGYDTKVFWSSQGFKEASEYAAVEFRKLTGNDSNWENLGEEEKINALKFRKERTAITPDWVKNEAWNLGMPVEQLASLGRDYLTGYVVNEIEQHILEQSVQKLRAPEVKISEIQNQVNALKVIMRFDGEIQILTLSRGTNGLLLSTWSDQPPIPKPE